MIALPIRMLGFPSPPFSCLVATILAAVSFQRVTRPENPTAPFQQTNAVARPARTSFSMQISFFGLILEASRRIFRRAHGSTPLPEALSLEGDPFPLRGTLPYLTLNKFGGILKIAAACPKQESYRFLGSDRIVSPLLISERLFPGSLSWIFTRINAYADQEKKKGKAI